MQNLLVPQGRVDAQVAQSYLVALLGTFEVPQGWQATVVFDMCSCGFLKAKAVFSNPWRECSVSVLLAHSQKDYQGLFELDGVADAFEALGYPAAMVAMSEIATGEHLLILSEEELPRDTQNALYQFYNLLCLHTP